MSDRFSVAGRLALVTGASSGLGRHFARLLAGEGATVILAARRMDRLKALEAAIQEAGGQAMAVEMDVTNAGSVQAAFDQVMAVYSSPPEIIVNNSGLSREGFFTRMDEADFDLVMDTNVKGVWLVARTFAGALARAGKTGSMINIASIAGRGVSHTLSAYCASKAACEHMTRGMALEMARYGIRVNAIGPGYFETEINDAFLASEEGQRMLQRIPLRRFGAHDELSGALLLLASEAGSYMTGTTLFVDGGHSLNTL